MAFLQFNKVHVAGIAAGVPKNAVSNLALRQGVDISKDYDAEAFVKTTGVLERRVSDALCTSDLCYAAAEKLIAELNWDKASIDALIFVSQTPDYILPSTACILQDRLGLSKECYANDSALGCSGWVYGLSQAASLIGNGTVKRTLLLVGDSLKNMADSALFGHAGTATALEFDENAAPIYCHYGTDGSGYDAIITPAGGSRVPVSPASFDQVEYEGKMASALQCRMKGMDVFSFGITTAPKSVKKLAEHFGFDYLSYDYFLFHQANMKMNDMIVKKLKLDPAKCPSEMLHFGNTSSASIPLLAVTQIRDQISDRPSKLICCGFGVGLSWGTVALDQTIHVPALVEVDDSEANYGYKPSEHV
jgi:3-oxoacyl-[acyl-carrier-protein] synthase III